MPFSYANDVGQHLSVYQLANDVLRTAYDEPNLANPKICPVENVDRLHIRQPILGKLLVNMGVREYESIGAQTPSPGHKDVELLNDRIAIQVSAEAQIENKYGDCISMIAEDQGYALAEALEIWIANAMQQTPLKIEVTAGTDADARSRWHHHVIPHTLYLLDRFKPTAVALNPIMWAHIQPVLNGTAGAAGNTSGQPYEWGDRIPGLDVPVVQSTQLPMDRMYVISAKATPMKCFQYDTMTPVIEYDPVINADTMYTGIWRTVASNFRQATKKTWTNQGEPRQVLQTGNAGIVEVTFTGAGFFGAVGGPAFADEEFADEDDVEKYITRENANILKSILDFGGKYLARQMKLAGIMPNDDEPAPEALGAMKKAFEPPKPAKVA